MCFSSHSVQFWNCFLNQLCTWFILFMRWYVCVSVCLPLKTLITSGMIWCNIGTVWLVKPVLQLFSILMLIKCMGMTIVTQCIMHAWQRRQRWCHTSHRMKHIKCLSVATRRSTSVIRWTGECIATCVKEA